MKYLRLDNEKIKIGEEIKDGNYYLNDDKEKLQYFGPLDRVNIFVGANNSGKSRFMRGLIKTGELVIGNNPDFIYQSNKMTNLIKEKAKFFNPLDEELYYLDISSPLEIAENFPYIYKGNERSINIIVHLASVYKILTDNVNILSHWESQETQENLYKNLSYVSESFAFIEAIRNGSINIKVNERNIKSYEKIEGHILEISNCLQMYLKEFQENELLVLQLTQIVYIPVIRTLSTLFEEVKDEKKNNTEKGYEENQKEEKNEQGEAEDDDKEKTKPKKIAKDIYKYSHIINYRFEREDSKLDISSGMDLYDKIIRARNSSKDNLNSFLEFEKFLSNNFFEGSDINIISKIVKKETEKHINVVLDEKDRDIHDLGDGIQSIIMLMFPIFMAEKGSWIFIEEPELNLHPGLQRIFLDTILNNDVIKEKELKIFFTTHSNHLLDLSLTNSESISIFTFEKQVGDKEENAKFLINRVNCKDYEILRLLGVNNTSVFLANCSIWVEGITDRIYFKAYLKAYCEKEKKPLFTEDIDFAFFEYGGGNIDHFHFGEEDKSKNPDKDRVSAFSLSNQILLIADGDAEKKNKRHEELESWEEDSKCFAYHRLKAREIENLIDKGFFDKIKGHAFSMLKNLEKVKNRSDIQWRDYKMAKNIAYIYNFNIENTSYVDKYFTLTSSKKKDLANAVANNITWEQMSKEAQKLTIKIYEFIKKHNQNRG